MINPKELELKTREELKKMVLELRAQIRDMRFKIAGRQYAKVRAMREARRDLARLLTTLARHEAGTKSQ